MQYHATVVTQNSFNSQPPEGGWKWICDMITPLTLVSTHSRPKAAGASLIARAIKQTFQLTAARRRLVPPLKPLTGKACIALFR